MNNNFKVNIEAYSYSKLGERPIWDDQNHCLIWADVYAGALHRLDPHGSDEIIAELDTSLGCVCLTKDGGYVAAAGDGFRWLDENGTMVGGPIRPPGMSATMRFNDGMCDNAGRFWAGTTSESGEKGACALYCLEPNGNVAVVLEGITESNGLSWSPEFDVMYYVDSGREDKAILRFPFNPATGNLGKPEILNLELPNGGVPDGLVVDSKGDLWIAIWNGSSVCRYSPEGILLRVYSLPILNPTCPGFGGDRLDTLFVTTAFEGLSEAERISQPLAGCVLSIGVYTKGLPLQRFG